MDGSIPLLDHPPVEEGMQQFGERVGRLHGVTPLPLHAGNVLRMHGSARLLAAGDPA
jgi:hypothetical protein